MAGRKRKLNPLNYVPCKWSSTSDSEYEVPLSVPLSRVVPKPISSSNSDNFESDREVEPAAAPTQSPAPSPTPAPLPAPVLFSDYSDEAEEELHERMTINPELLCGEQEMT